MWVLLTFYGDFVTFNLHICVMRTIYYSGVARTSYLRPLIAGQKTLASNFFGGERTAGSKCSPPRDHGYGKPNRRGNLLAQQERHLLVRDA